MKAIAWCVYGKRVRRKRMTTSEDLKAEFEKWFDSVFTPLHDAYNEGSRGNVEWEELWLPNPVWPEACFMKGAELGEAIGYQKGRGYERKNLLEVIHKVYYTGIPERELLNAILDPHEG